MAQYNSQGKIIERTSSIHHSTGEAITNNNGLPVQLAGSLVDFSLNTEGVLLPSLLRTAQTTTSDQVNFNGKGVIIYLNVTVASGTGGLFVRIEGKDPASGNYAVLNSNPTGITATGLYAYELYPGSSSTGSAGSPFVQQRTAGALPRTWRVRMGVTDSSTYTYSLGYAIII